MNKIILKVTLFIGLVTLLTNCQMKKAYKKLSDGIQIRYPEAILTVHILAPEIIRVTYSPYNPYPRESLIIEKADWEPGDWEVTQEENLLILATSRLKVQINESTGELAFFDPDGNLIVKEKEGGGKTLEKTVIQDKETYHIRQQWETTGDEALYGLGQHQDRLMDIKGYEIDLWQRNLKAVVPFLVSTKNYGILWDNYSYTRYGSLEDAKPVPAGFLTNTKGESGGLTAEFFSDQEFRRKLDIPDESTEISIPVVLPENWEDKILSARWSGQLSVDESGEYQFFNTGQQYFRMWLDDQLVTDYWSSFLIETDETRLQLEAGKVYKIEIEYVRNNIHENMDLTWRTPEMKKPYNSLWSRAGDGIDYYFIHGGNLDEVITRYRELTGSATLMPKWAYGFWQCKERYKTQDEIIGVVREFRKKRIPLDNIVLDWQYWKPDQWGAHEFDEARFPNPDVMMEELHYMNSRIMISVWPKFYTNTENFKKLNEAGYIYPYNVEEGTTDWLDGIYAYYDAYHPDARKMYWDQINKHLFSKGIDAWWLDATEPETRSNQGHEEMAERMNPNHLGTGAEYLNAYSLMTCKGVYEGQRNLKPDQRVYILTRSAFAGQQRYAATTWSGDVTALWNTLKAQIPCGLNFCLSGIPYWTTDIGAFTVPYEGGNRNEEYRELFTRWYQYGVFCPIFRVHGTHTPREIWHFGGPDHPAYNSQLEFNKLRYALMPYIYSLGGHATHSHYTIMRALAMDFAQDSRVYDIGDQFMFGPAILVNPVTDYKARQRQVYLPGCLGWYDFWTGEFLDGGQEIIADAPYERLPLFVRAGSILPFGPEIQFTDEVPADPVTLWIYTGDDAHFTLYEDDGLTYGYERGEYVTINFVWNEEEQTLTIGKKEGQFPGMLNERTFNIIWVDKNNPAEYSPEVKYHKSAKYTDRELTILRED